MKKFALTLLSALAIAAPAAAQQKLRVQVDQRGDFALIGNTLGWDCGAGAPAPIVGTLPTNCGLNWADTSIDAFWRADEPVAGQATANASYDATQARSTAYLDLPAGATVTHAFLYWGARNDAASADTTAMLERPGVFMQTVTAVSSYVAPSVNGAGTVYQSVADVTGLVRAQGVGAYRVSGVDTRSLVNANEDVLYAGWGMVVFYQLDSLAPRNLALFDGLDDVQSGGSASISLSGFLVPSAGYDAKLGVIAYEGDNQFAGDSLLFGQGPILTPLDALSDAQNPFNNFFNSTRSTLGQPVHHAGDLPEMTGTPLSMSGLDLDIVDVTARVVPGQTSANIFTTSNLDTYFMGAFITSISTFRPDFTPSTKTVRDVNGSALMPGDEIEYTITAINQGNDTSANSVLHDVIPTGTTYVPGSLSVVSGANAGPKTDAAGDDQGYFDATTRTVIVYLGTGATATMGGAIPVGQSSVISFRVKIDPTTKGVVANQGIIDASGAKGAPNSTTVTDGNGPAPGSPTTDIPVGGCTSNADCGGATPICDLATMTCVQCTTNAQCPGSSATCDLMTKTCQCNGPAVTCMDTDKDGLGDGDEIMHGTDPNDADSDDDGVPDGQEVTPFMDSDGDGLINALDPDSDDDGLFDGTEQGFNCSGPGTDATKGHCRPDLDPTTMTDPTKKDTDGGGATDGSEDTNLNGKLDGGERDPTAGHGSDDKSVVDTDGDGLSDPLEDTLHSDPRDRDTDDDGLLDGDERNPSDDTDGDKVNNVNDRDSDNDGLLDGTESGKDCSSPDTKKGRCIPDADLGMTTTSPVIWDTDKGGASDGSEDSNLDGKIDMGERNPTLGNGADDAGITDSDGDGLSDNTETHIGSDPKDADTDNDGVPDGKEANPADDTDGDGKPNVLDPDSDNDGLGDGTETGSQCDNPATDRSKNQCVPDADKGKTTTSPINPDTDYGGVPDGVEDTNHNGQIDPGERDPNLTSDDNGATADDGVQIAGGGCDCAVQPTFASAGWWALALAGLLYRRRRRHAD